MYCFYFQNQELIFWCILMRNVNSDSNAATCRLKLLWSTVIALDAKHKVPYTLKITGLTSNRYINTEIHCSQISRYAILIFENFVVQNNAFSAAFWNVGVVNGPPKIESLGKFYPSLGISQNYLMGLAVLDFVSVCHIYAFLLQSNQVKRFAQESRFGFVVQNLNSFFVRTSQVQIE